MPAVLAEVARSGCYGIWFVLAQLNEVSIADRKALPTLMKKNPGPWKQTFFENIKTWIETATPQVAKNASLRFKRSKIGLRKST